MKKAKENKKDSKTKQNKKEYKKSIPIEIRAAFGKFYIFSIILSIFLGIVYNFIVEKISFITGLLILLFSLLFYIYIFIDFLNRKKSFMSSTVVFCIILYLFTLGFAIYKFIMSC